MGMLDKLAFDDAEDSFPNFDYSYGHERASSLQLNQVSTNNSTSSASSTSSSSSCASSSSRNSLPRVTFSSASAASEHRSSKSLSSRRHTHPPRRTRTADDRKATAVKESRRKSADFDLTHDDEELQEAESYLYWCETCLKHCDVPAHRQW